LIIIKDPFKEKSARHYRHFPKWTSLVRCEWLLFYKQHNPWK